MEQRKAMTPKLALRLAAPHTWPASIGPALFGELYCLIKGYPLTVTVAIALLLACILMQAAVNALNDYFDFIKGTDSMDDCVEVSDAVLVYEQVNPTWALWLAIAFLGAAAVMVLPILLTVGIAPLVIGFIGVVIVFCYYGGPMPLSYLPVGEFISGFVMGGLIPVGIAAAVTGGYHWDILVASMPFMIGIGLIMMTNNTCDIEKDGIAKRRTLPVLLGRQKAVQWYRRVVLAWLVLLAFLPCFLLGTVGMLSVLLLVVAARRPFGFLLSSPVQQEQRVAQMKGILMANVFGNGAYLITLAATILIGGTVHG